MARVGAVDLELHPSGPRAWDPDTANDWAQAVADAIETSTVDGDVFSVKAYGAVGDGITDDTTAVEDAIEAASDFITANGYGATVYLPRGEYVISRPLYIPAKCLLKGAGMYVSSLQAANGFGGYNLIISDDKTAGGSNPSLPQYTTALLTGSGVAYQQNSAHANAIDLTQSPSMRLPSSGGWTLAFSFKTASDAVLNDFKIVWQWGGSLYSGRYASPLMLLRADSGALNFMFRYNGEQYFKTVATASMAAGLVANTLYNFEISWNGSNALRVFVNGELWTLGAYTPSAPSGGTLDSTGFISYPDETCTFGGSSSAYVGEDAVDSDNVKGTFDAIHFSSGVRHTAAYTNPTAKPTPDGSTIVLVNFDEFYKGCVVGKGANGLSKHYFYPLTEQLNNAKPQVEIRDLAMSGGWGIKAEFARSLRIENVQHLNVGDGWRFTHNCYYSRFRNVSIENGAGRVAFMDVGGAFLRYDSLNVAGPISMACFGTLFTASQIDITIQATYYTGAYFGGVGAHISGLNVDAEVVMTTPYQRTLIVDSPSYFVVDSGYIVDPPSGTHAPVELVQNQSGGAGHRVEFNRCYFGAVPVGQPIVIVGGANSWVRPAIVRDPVYTGSPALASPLNAAVDPDAVAEFQIAVLGTAAPASGTWAKGNMVINSNPTAGGTWAWVCTTAGTPGTWKAIAIAA